MSSLALMGCYCHCGAILLTSFRKSWLLALLENGNFNKYCSKEQNMFTIIIATLLSLDSAFYALTLLMGGTVIAAPAAGLL